jgi:hypothetical protein
MVIIFTIYVITAAEAYGLFSRVVKFTFNYLQKKSSFINLWLDIKRSFLFM